MREDSLEKLFAIYQRSGDTRALAEVFDRTAVDLLRFARYLTRNRTDAEDLLQDTWLTAIERAASYDAERPLRPWLVGILAKRSASARRKGKRTSTKADLDLTHNVDPQQVAADHEIHSRLAKAVDDLPPTYREVLTPRLNEGARSQDIARDVGRSPGVVRMQITRGLRLLRQAMPAGALSAAFLLTRGRTMAAVRDNTLRAAATKPHLLATTGSALAGSGPTVLGGLLMFKKLALVAVAIAALIVTYVWIDTRSPEDTALGESSKVAISKESMASPSVAPPVERSPISPSVEAVPELPSIQTIPTSYQQQLSGIRGRLLEADGTPVADTPVTLLEVDPSDLIGQMSKMLAEPMLPPHLFGAESKTDAEGHFLLQGAHARAAHGIGIDLGGPRAAVRVFFDRLAAGNVLDVGDVVLDPVVSLVGRVVDEKGEPIAGARVRAAMMPLPPTLVGAEFLRSDSHVLIHDRGAIDAMPIPAWARQILDRLPIPTTKTAEDGTFQLTGVPTGMVTAIVDHDQYVATVKGPVPSGKGGGSRDVGDIPLSDGVTATGRVVDTNGEPVVGVPVLVATIPDLDVVGFARETTTDSDGRFEIPHMPEFRRTRIASRAQPFVRWTILDVDDPEEEIELKIPAGLEIVVNVRDENGQPVDGVDLRIAPRSPMHEIADFFRGWPENHATPSADTPGQYRIAPLTEGQYVIVASADGCLVTRTRARITEPMEIDLVLKAANPRSVRVVFGPDRAPVEYAQVSVVHPDTSEMALEQTRTDADGRATITLVPNDGEGVLRIRHPGFAPLSAKIPAIDEFGDGEIEVLLRAGGDLLGRIDTGGFAPTERYLFLLTSVRPPLEVDEFPNITLTDGRGDFRLDDLEAGEYRYEIARNPIANDPLRVGIDDLDDLETLCRGDCTIQDGETTQLSIPFFAPGMPTACTVRGVVRKNGQPVRAIASIYQQRYQSTECDEQGRFELSDIAPGAARLDISSGLAFLGDGVSFSTNIELQPGEIRDLVFDLQHIEVDFRVTSADGDLIEKEVFLSIEQIDPGVAPLSMNARIGPDQPPLALPGPGRYRASVVGLQLGRGQVEFNVPATSPVTLRLEPTIPCSGYYKLPKLDDETFYIVTIRYGEGDDAFGTSLSGSTRGGPLPFSYTGFPVGTIDVEFYLDEKVGQVQFELPDGGATDLVVTPVFDS